MVAEITAQSSSADGPRGNNEDNDVTVGGVPDRRGRDMRTSNLIVVD